MQHRRFMYAVEFLRMNLKRVDESGGRRRQAESVAAQDMPLAARSPTGDGAAYVSRMRCPRARDAHRQRIVQEDLRRLLRRRWQGLPFEAERVIDQRLGGGQCGSSPPETFMLSAVI
jgi:hypothetical protein